MQKPEKRRRACRISYWRLWVLENFAPEIQYIAVFWKERSGISGIFGRFEEIRIILLCGFRGQKDSDSVCASREWSQADMTHTGLFYGITHSRTRRIFNYGAFNKNWSSLQCIILQEHWVVVVFAKVLQATLFKNKQTFFHLLCGTKNTFLNMFFSSRCSVKTKCCAWRKTRDSSPSHGRFVWKALRSSDPSDAARCVKKDFDVRLLAFIDAFMGFFADSKRFFASHTRTLSHSQSLIIFNAQQWVAH